MPADSYSPLAHRSRLPLTLATLSRLRRDFRETLGVAGNWQTLSEAPGHATLRVGGKRLLGGQNGSHAGGARRDPGSRAGRTDGAGIAAHTHAGGGRARRIVREEILAVRGAKAEAQAVAAIAPLSVALDGPAGCGAAPDASTPHTKCRTGLMLNRARDRYRTSDPHAGKEMLALIQLRFFA